MDDAARRAEVARLNDAFRHAGGGTIVLTAGIAALPISTREAIIAEIRGFRHADADDSEHRVGSVTVEGAEAMWFILYHRHDHTPEPDADPAALDTTGRALVIMLAGEP
jgi:hypothetical protein